MLLGWWPKQLLTLFCLGKQKMVLRSGTSHTKKQVRLQIACGTSNIMRWGKNTTPCGVGCTHNIGTWDGSLTMSISRRSGTQSRHFNFQNAVLYLHLMWPSLLLRKWSHPSPPFNTFTPSPEFQQPMVTDGLHYKLADDIPQCDNDRHSQWLETDILPHMGAPINNTVRIQLFEDEDWYPLAVFATPKQWQLCSSIVDTNLGNMKLNNVLKRRLIVPDSNAENPDQLDHLITDMNEMDGLRWRLEERSINIERKATLFWYRNPIAVVQYIQGHPRFTDHILHTAVKQIDSNHEHIYTMMGTTDSWRKMQATFLVSSLIEPREIMSERT